MLIITEVFVRVLASLGAVDIIMQLHGRTKDEMFAAKLFSVIHDQSNATKNANKQFI